MDQQKIGALLKELRRQRAVTQEQLAEMLNVSRRTVSRWETGSNMPDLDILIEIADYYKIDIRELLDGERRSGQMEEEMKETVWKMMDYSNEKKLKYMRRLHGCYIVALISFLIYLVTLFLKPGTPNGFFDFVQGLTLGISFGMIVVGVLMTGKHGQKLRALKMRLLKKQGLMH